MSEGTRYERYRVNEPSVIHQAIDGELVIIHLDHGLYYSLDATGARIWAALAAGQPPASVSESMARDAAADAGVVDAAVNALIEQLRSEDLLVPIGGDHAATSAVDQAGDESHAGDDGLSIDGQTPFAPPVLQRYDDLQDLLLLDPIHAVDESGWPDRPDDA